MTKYDSKVPDLHGFVSVFILSFFNILNLIVLTKLIILNRSFFMGYLPKLIVVFFQDYKIWIILFASLLLVINNILLYKQAKNIKTIYDKMKSSIYVFSYFIFSLLCWLFIMVFDKL
jgi:hypothetical protein